MTADLLIDAEALTVAALRAAPAVAALVGTRVSTRFPSDFPSSGSSLRVTLVGHLSSRGHGHLQRANIQVVGYGPGPNTGPTAHLVTATAYKALLELRDSEVAAFPGVVITDVVPYLGLVTAPDEPTATSGYRFAVMLHIHRAGG